MAKLKRALGLFEATLYGVGIIVGAGIYALIGKVCGLAGNAVWISFALSSLLALFTGLSYAELSSLFPKDAAEYEYAKATIKNKFVGLLVTWFVIGSFIVSASAVAIGFGNYLAALLFGQNWNWTITLGFIQINWPVIFAILSILVFTYINFRGIEISSDINIPSTILEVGGLILVVLGVLALLLLGKAHPVNYLEMPNGWHGVFSGAILAFFAYIGFGSITKMGEEMRDPEKNMPRAIILSIIITTILYILVAIASVTVVPWTTLYNAPNPAALVAGTIHPWLNTLLAIIALFSTGNTILLILITTSRMMYGVAKEGGLPRVLAKVHPKTKTPYISVAVVGITSLLVTLFKDIQVVAEVTNIWIFFVYIFVNLAVILLRYEKPGVKRVFRMPVNLGKFPVLAGLGLITSTAMFVYSFFMIKLSPTHPGIWMTGLLILLAAVFYLWGQKGERKATRRPAKKAR